MEVSVVYSGRQGIDTQIMKDRNERFRYAGWSYRFEFGGRFPFDDVVEWCKHNLPETSYTYEAQFWWFREEESFFNFVMRWK